MYKYTMFYAVATIHLLWGLLLLSVKVVPIPFGGLDPYLDHMSAYTLAYLLLATSTCGFIGASILTRSTSIFGPIFVTPQQGLLVWWAWAVIIAILENPSNDRLLLASAYILSIAFWHTVKCFDVYYTYLSICKTKLVLTKELGTQEDNDD